MTVTDQLAAACRKLLLLRDITEASRAALARYDESRKYDADSEWVRALADDIEAKYKAALHVGSLRVVADHMEALQAEVDRLRAIEKSARAVSADAVPYNRAGDGSVCASLLLDLRAVLEPK